MPQTLRRNSQAYSPDYRLCNANEPVRDFVQRSPFAGQDVQPLSHSYTTSTTEYTYAQIISTMQGLQTSYPAWITYYDIGDSVQLREMGALTVGDVGNRPIIYVDCGMHGDEDNVTRAVLDFAEQWVIADHPVLNYARDHLTLMVIGTVNPDGQVAGTRRNANNVNLNRQGPNYWINASDTDKGATPFAEVEMTNIKTFLETSSRVGRIISATNIHGWTSRAEYGFLTEQQYHSIKSQMNQRRHFMYPLHLAEKRSFTAFLPRGTRFLKYDTLLVPFSAEETITGGTSGAQAKVKKVVPVTSAGTLRLTNIVGTFIDNEALTGSSGGSATTDGGVFDKSPTWQEFRSKMKPYLAEWIWRNGRRDCWSGLIEFPEIETDGLNMLMTYDFLLGVTMACCHTIQPEKRATVVLPAIPPPLNKNSRMVDWDSAEDRPQWMRKNGITNVHYPNGLDGDARPFVRITRPAFSAYPNELSKASAALVYNDESTDAFVIMAGDTASGPVSSGRRALLPPEVSTPSAGNLPQSLQNGHMSTDNTNLYHSGGHTGAAYVAAIYTADARDPATAGWSLWHTLAVARQRHTSHIWNDGVDDYLIIVGGRDATGYRTDVVKVKLSDKTESTIGNFATARGYHASAIRGNTLFVFGGWNNPTVLSSVESMDLTTGTPTTETSLPAARRMQAYATDTTADFCYLFFGNNGAGNPRTQIYRYNLSAKTVSTISYTLASEEDDEGNPIVIPDPDVNFGLAYYHPVDDCILIYVGEKDNGTFLDTIYEYDIDTTTLYLRDTVNTRWGYMRSSQAFQNYAQGDQFTVNLVASSSYDITAANSYPTTTDDKVPYMRIAAIINPLSNWTEITRLGYTVPPIAHLFGFHTFTNTYALVAGESELRIYARIYGDGTHYNLAALQVVKAPFCPVIVPDSGKAEDVLVERFAGEITSDAQNGGAGSLNELRTVTGTISPFYAAQMDVTQVLLDFDMTPDSPLQQLQVVYEGETDFTEPIPITATLDALPPSGKFRLNWIEDGTSGNEIFFNKLSLNHSKANRTYRRDSIDWTLSSQNGSVTLTLDAFGKVYSKTFNPGATIIGYTATGAGGSYSEASYTSAACPAGFARLDGSELSAFETCPVDGSTAPYLGMDRYRIQYAITDRAGIPVMSMSKGIKHLWRFAWNSITPTFADWLVHFAKLRTFLFLPDVNNPADEYRVRCEEGQLQLVERGANRIDVEMTIREYP